MTYHTISMWLVLSVGITGTAMENTETSASEVTFVTLGTSGHVYNSSEMLALSGYLVSRPEKIF